MPLLSQIRPTTTEGTKNKQSTRLALPSSGSIWHCVRPQAMLDSPARVNLQLTPLKSQRWAEKIPPPTSPLRGLLASRRTTWGEQTEEEKTAHNLENTSDFPFHGIEYRVGSWSIQHTTLECWPTSVLSVACNKVKPGTSSQTAASPYQKSPTYKGPG